MAKYNFIHARPASLCACSRETSELRAENHFSINSRFAKRQRRRRRCWWFSIGCLVVHMRWYSLLAHENRWRQSNTMHSGDADGDEDDGRCNEYHSFLRLLLWQYTFFDLLEWIKNAPISIIACIPTHERHQNRKQLGINWNFNKKWSNYYSYAALSSSNWLSVIVLLSYVQTGKWKLRSMNQHFPQKKNEIEMQSFFLSSRISKLHKLTLPLKMK